MVEAVFQYSTANLTGEDAKLANTALMVMGAIAKNQQGSDFATQITQRIAESLQVTESQPTSAALLAALGNSGDSSHEKLISHYLQNGGSRLRSEAAMALGKMPSETSLNILSNKLSQEQDGKVQGAILKAMGRNALSPDQVNRVYQFASTNQNREVRSAAIDTLALQAKDNDKLKPHLLKLLKTEKNKRNLQKIMKALYGH